MKKILLSILLVSNFQLLSSQVINQPSNWPNSEWTTAGTYNDGGLLADPSVADSFTFDDDAAGSTSDDDIHSESPTIDLTSAYTAGENLILISGDYTHYDIGGALSLDYWDADASSWISVLELGGSEGASTQTYPSCSSLVYFEAGVDITNFTSNQMSNFKYRYAYDDADGWQWGWCIKNSVLVSGGAAVPGCDAAIISPANGDEGVDVNPTITWSNASGFPEGYYISLGTSDGGTEILNNIDSGNVNSYSISNLSYSTMYFVTILPYNSSGAATESCSSYNFTTITDPNTYLDCTSGPVNTSFCYDTGLDNSYSFTSDDGSPLNLTINSGQVENNFDELIILDSDGTELYNGYGTGGDVSGLTFQSTGDNITLIVDEDGSISCISSGYNPIDFSVACATCVNPIANYTMVSDCLNAPQFFVDVDVVNIGSASSLTISDNQASTTQSATATGVFTFGPYPNNTQVQISIANDDDANCSISSSSITQEFCTTTLVDCNSGPITLDYCYENGDTNEFTYTSSDNSALVLTIDSGNVENNYDELTVIDSDGTLIYSGYGNGGDISGLTFQSTGDTISFSILSDGSISCGSGSSSLVGGINYTVACATCINPQATYTVIDDCANGDQFLIDVDVTSVGDADSLSVTDNYGSDAIQVSSTGVVQMGPYPFLTDIIVTLSNEQDVNCVINSSPIQLFACPPDNDNCNGALSAVVNIDESCDNTTTGTITAATSSGNTSSCVGDTDDDVWFEFTALSEVHMVSLLNITGSTTNIDHALYDGSCDDLTELYCSTDSSSVTTALTIGNSYFLRVFSGGSNNENVDFELCIKDAPDNTVCENASNFCAEGGALYGSNIFDYPSLGQIACLYSTPNPSWNLIQIGDPGLVEIEIVQNTQFDDNGNAVGTGLDVDFVLWGPFTAEDNYCETGILDQGCPEPGSCPNNTFNADFYPFGNIIDCSYSIYDVENATIENAQSGEIYVLLITNYSNTSGTIQIQQTNSGSEGAGSTVAEIEVELGDDQEICGSENGFEITANSSFADTFEWYQNGILIEGELGSSITVNESDIYTVIAYDEQCASSAQDSVEINFYTPTATTPNQMLACDDSSRDGQEFFDLSSQDETVFGDENISLYVVSYYDNEENALNGENSLETYFENTSNPQTIYARIENPLFNGCFDITSFELVVEDPPLANFDENFNYEVCPNATVAIDIGILTNENLESISISWDFNGELLVGENEITLGVIEAGEYQFTVNSNTTGCIYSESIEVIELENCVIPQGISPNGDGYNDHFDVSSYNVTSLKVFNRYGTLVYSKNNYTNEWNGQSNNGEKLPVGTYFYVMNYDVDKVKTDWIYINY